MPSPDRFTPGKDPVPIVQEVGWAPGSVWTDAENLAPTGIPSLDLQPVASRYADYATRPTIEFERRRKYAIKVEIVREVTIMCRMYQS